MKVKFQQFDKDNSQWKDITDNRFEVEIVIGTIDDMPCLKLYHHNFPRYYHGISNINFLSHDWNVVDELLIDVDSEDSKNDYLICITAENKKEQQYIDLMQHSFHMIDRNKETEYVLFVPVEKVCRSGDVMFDNFRNKQT